MRKKTIKAIQAHAVECYPQECCGLVIMANRRELYIPCPNKAQSDEDFKIDAQDYANAEDQGRVIAVVHSHPGASDHPSEGDLVACEASGLPWYIIAVAKEGAAQTINRIQPDGYTAPLLGREFFHGTLDCYTLVYDFYKRILHIELPQIQRNDNWWNNGQNLYIDNFKKAGFYQVEDGSLQFGDVILMQIRAPVANHAGVYIGDISELEGQRIHPIQYAFLHHLYGYASQREIYGGQWAENTVMLIRHKDTAH